MNKNNILFPDIIPTPVLENQVINIGGRNFDEAEKESIYNNNLSYTKNVNMSYINKELLNKKSQNIYIHLDLDAITPTELINTPIPENGGIKSKEVLELINYIKNNFSLKGIGIYEYAPQNKNLNLFVIFSIL